MNSVLLVIPPGMPGTTPNREGASGLGAVEPTPDAFRYPPHTVASVGACLRNDGLHVSALDAVALGLDRDQCLARVREAQPAIVAVFVSWATREVDIRFLKDLGDDTVTGKVVAFGPGARFIERERMVADVRLDGEPELAMVSLCRGLFEGREVPAIVSAGEMSGYDSEGLISDLDDLPVPAWELLPIDRYPFLSILSSRGCDHGCGWCPYIVVQGQHYRPRSPASVVHELRHLVQRFHPARIIFRDPVFARDRERLVAICHQILGDPVLQPGRNLKWECETQPEHLDVRLVRLMSLAGCIGIKVGLETTDADLLSREGRVAGEEQAAAYLARAAALARECEGVGIAYRVFVMAGLPGQTIDAARETAGFVTALRPQGLSVKRFKAYPDIRSRVDGLPTEAEVRQQMELLQGAREAIASQPQRRPSRWRRALVRRVYRLQARLCTWRG